MDYQESLRKRDVYQKGKYLIPELTITSYEGQCRTHPEFSDRCRGSHEKSILKGCP